MLWGHKDPLCAPATPRPTDHPSLQGHKVNLWVHKTSASTQHFARNERLMASPLTTARRIKK